MTYLGLPDAAVIFLAAAIFSVLVNFANRALGVKQRTTALQKEVNEFQKEYQAAVKANNEAEIKRLKIREPDVMKKMQEMMFLPFKSMIVVLPLFYVFILLLGGAFPHFTIHLPIALHLNGHELFGLNILQSSTYGPRGFFILSGVLCGMVIEAVAGRVLKK